LGLWEQLPVRHRDLGEVVAWEGRAALVTSVGVGDDFQPVDEAGSEAGFLVITNQKLVVGHLGKLLGKPVVWYAFELANVELMPRHPRGVAFTIIEGPVGFVAGIPTEDDEGLRRVASTLLQSRPVAGPEVGE
jgi:hypothetical protein